MAKFSAYAAVLFCLFTVSAARSPSQKDDTAVTSVRVHLSDIFDPLIRLPSDPDSKNSDPRATSTIASVPLTFASSRPINRRFAPRSKRPCHHHDKMYARMGETVEIPDGNTISGEMSASDEPEMIHEAARRWMRLRLQRKNHHHEDSEIDGDGEGDRIVKMVFNKRYDFDRFDREKKLKVLKQMRKHFREEGSIREEGGFKHRMRKFLDGFF